jgi:hypothetical protein
MSASTNPIMPCEENEVVSIALTTLAEASLDNDFIPIVKLDKTFQEKGFKYTDSGQKYSLSPYIEEQEYALETVVFDGDDDEITLRFEIKKGNSLANDNRGYLNAIGHGVKIISQTGFTIKYDYKILLKISKDEIKSGAYIDFYANDNDWKYYTVSNVHCGRIMVSEEKESIIRIVRKWEYDSGSNSTSSTIGTFTIDNDSLTGYILEPYGESTTQGGQDKRVPAGTYSMIWHTSARYPKTKYVSKGREELNNGFPKIYNNNVSQNRAILIHVGNSGGDSAGCLLPGGGITVATINNKKKVTGVTSSTDKFYDLIEYIESKGIENVKIIITEAYEDYK